MSLIAITITIALAILYVRYLNSIYYIAFVWATIFLLIVNTAIFPSTSRLKVIINKKNNSLRLYENNREQYTSNYPLSDIKSIKSSVSQHAFSISYLNYQASLIAVLKDNPQVTLISTKLTDDFYIDTEANKYARIGRKIAEFLGVPFQEEYNPAVI